MTIFVGLFLPLVIGLGFWQLQRGAEKRELEFQYMSKITQLPSAPTENALGTPFQRVRLKGRFAPEIFLLDNQVAAGKPGYWVIQLFHDDSGVRVLVNRGYVPAPPSRETLPEIAQPTGKVSMVGVIWPFTGLIPVLDDDIWQNTWPRRVQRLDMARMAETVNASALEVRLEAGQPGVFLAAPFAAVLNDARHRGYAATWFGLALALFVLYLIYGFKKS